MEGKKGEYSDTSREDYQDSTDEGSLYSSFGSDGQSAYNAAKEDHHSKKNSNKAAHAIGNEIKTGGFPPSVKSNEKKGSCRQSARQAAIDNSQSDVTVETHAARVKA